MFSGYFLWKVWLELPSLSLLEVNVTRVTPSSLSYSI
jgi:hypothetical protein